MAEQEEAGQMGNDKREDIRRRLANINQRIPDLANEISIQKSSYEVDPDNQADNFAFHLKRCRRALYSLYAEREKCEADFKHCIRDTNLNPEWQFEEYRLELDIVRRELDNVRYLIWECWLNDLKERGETHSMFREAMRVVQGLPVLKITEDHLIEKVKCSVCRSHHFDIAEEVCKLHCFDCRIFHSDCIEYAWKYVADINDQACFLKSEFFREKTAFETNQASDFASQLNMIETHLKSLQLWLSYFESRIYNCKCSNYIPECTRYGDTLKRVEQNLVEVKKLIRDASDILQFVERLPAVEISENGTDKDVVCAICLSDSEIEDELCHLPCNEGHIFHRNCIAKWLNVKNQCPSCRKPAKKRSFRYCRIVR